MDSLIRVLRMNAFSVGCIAILWSTVPAYAEDWLPVTPEELKMTSEPKAPAAQAIVLYRQVDRDDNGPFEDIYERIKILTEEGRKLADVQIPYNKRTETIRGLEARTIRPDGSIVKFDGTLFDKPIVQGRGVKLLAKTFTLPDVQVGSIIEYRYRHVLQYGYVFDSHWILSQELFTKHAKYSLVQSEWYALRYSWPLGLPEGSAPPKKERGKIRLETHDVPAFVSEEMMPPESELKYRVDFIYRSEASVDKITDPDIYWKKLGKLRYDGVQEFVNKRGPMEKAVAEIVAPGDTPEQKLKKIYARVQSIRNLSFEEQKSDEEIKREGRKDANSVADVWKRGYGDGLEVTWLFLALVRAAGFEADPVLVSTRDVFFFNPRLMNPNQLNSNVILVKLDGKQLFFDPGTKYCPFGMLPWNETGVMGLRLDKEGGAWISTPVPLAAESRTERKAKLKLDARGSLEGTLTVTYTGLEALMRRLEERGEDAADRKEYLENQVKWDAPTGLDVELVNSPDWESSEPTLTAEYRLKVPGWAATAGQRLLMPVGLFGERETRHFKHAERVHKLYLIFPASSNNEVTIELPTGYQVSNLPKPHEVTSKVIEFNNTVEQKNGTLLAKRRLASNWLLVDSKFYSALRDAYQSVRASDEEQIVIASASNAGKR